MNCIFCDQPLEDGAGAEWCVDCNLREEIDKLRQRVVKLEAALAATQGSMAPPEADEQAQFTWDVPPNAPGHERATPPEEK